MKQHSVEEIIARLARIERARQDKREQPKANGYDTEARISIADFAAYMPGHNYIFKPTRELWPALSVTARIGWVGKMRASAWLDVNRPIEQMTWAPGEPMEIKDKLIAEGGWIRRPGCTVFNLYRPPALVPKRGDVSPWVEHGTKVYGEDFEHVVRWLAHRVQRPHEKINHALVLGGGQGIGKDTLLEPVKQAVGPWNFIEVSPRQILGRFNGFVKSVILRVNEARDLGDRDRYAFYDHMKAYTAAPPDVLRVDEKYLREISVPNVCGAIITSNYKTDGIYLAADDRRHYVAWSNRTEMDFEEGYWRDLYGWYKGGGVEHVAAYLATYELTNFDPKAPPPKTSAFYEIAGAGKAPEEAELADALDKLGRPDAVTLSQVADKAALDFAIWIRDRRNSRLIPHRMEACGYVAVQNPADKSDGRWRVNDKRQVIYGKADLPVPDRTVAAMKLAGVRP
jgi:Family of unknown function (DUF5906)